MKKTTIIVKDGNLAQFLNQIDSTPHLERMTNKDLEEMLSKEFDINLIQKEVRDFGEENLKDLLDKLHALPDDELQDTLRTYPTIREIWHKHFTQWVFGDES
ncbi:hypothetical protein GF339_20905 [candidate division KSB3 bacterium]|uniref:Uncharacterized protein n=1 Tax=candidate division KSB3 bacterium TaxID=2044937 RepID=A0A9D5Q7N4_9BACT|nr:hypothetical protein [candidate division KSB3 bacterium]MBD3327059.1 hypothetical protein [candidate division KSB3 bacterium]